MRSLTGLRALSPPPGGASIAIGTFDGVHVGHRALIQEAVAGARELGATPVVVTWDRHPAATLAPSRVPPLLTTAERRAELIEGCGVGVLAVLAFDAGFSRWPPERFVAEVLVEGLGARAVYVGRGWRFGHRAAGDVDLLAALGSSAGFRTEAVDLVEVRGEVVSSTRVRSAIAAGELEDAASMLGRFFDLDGTVLRGDARGRALGFPTANLAIDPALVHPPRGVYAGRARIRAEPGWHRAAINVGVNPTFARRPDGADSIEVHLMDWSGDLYGTVLRVEFWTRLRDELTFQGPEGLIEQMRRDLDDVIDAVPAGALARNRRDGR